MNDRIFFIILVSAGLLLAGITAHFFFSATCKTPAIIKPAAEATENPEITIKETKLSVFVQKNIKDCKITTKESKIFPKQNKTECTLVTCSLTTKKNLLATITAPSALIDHDARQIFFPGTSTGLLQKSTKNGLSWSLLQENTRYDAKKESIKTDQIVLSTNRWIKSTCRGISIKAPKSIIDLKKEVITLLNGVTSHFEK